LGRNKDNPLADDQFLRTHFYTYFRNNTQDQSNSSRTLQLRNKADYHTSLLEKIFVTKNILAEAGPDRLTIQKLYE
jgi:hypothetical protein